jgi:hypothetical protein
MVSFQVSLTLLKKKHGAAYIYVKEFMLCVSVSVDSLLLEHGNFSCYRSSQAKNEVHILLPTEAMRCHFAHSVTNGLI